MTGHKTIKVKTKDLPVRCPPTDRHTTELHPVVYLPIEEFIDKKATCYYCGQTYELDDSND
ncbi:MAG: hypothetical protein CMF46_04920 [Legionellales bacterium]|nr:hypothetical protein [Legionellales bacterium]